MDIKQLIGKDGELIIGVNENKEPVVVSGYADHVEVKTNQKDGKVRIDTYDFRGLVKTEFED